MYQDWSTLQRFCYGLTSLFLVTISNDDVKCASGANQKILFKRPVSIITAAVPLCMNDHANASANN